MALEDYDNPYGLDKSRTSTSGFVMVSGGIEGDWWHEVGFLIKLFELR